MRKTKSLLFAALAIFMMAMQSCTVVDNSEVGIKFKKFGLTNQGELDAYPCTGWVMYNPFTTAVYTYPVFVQQVDYDAFTVNTKDAAQFKMDPYMSYYLNRDMAVHVFSTYRKPLKNIEAGYMKTCIYDAYRITANQYTSDELMANRAEFEASVKMMLDSTLSKEGFVLKEFTSQIIPPASLQQMIDAKNQAIQSALRAENQVKEAEANAKIAIAKAQGEAEALRIQADGEAYYNRTVAASLNSLLVQQYAIEKWDGDLPTYTGGGAIPFIDLK